MAQTAHMGPSSCTQEGRGSVSSMPPAMMAGMYPQCSSVCSQASRVAGQVRVAMDN